MRSFLTIGTFVYKRFQGENIASPGVLGRQNEERFHMPRRDIPIKEFYDSFRRDVATFKEKLPELLQKFPGQYVAILDGQVVAHMAEWKALIDLTQREYPDKFVLVEHVVERTNEVLDMDSIEG
jgi:hypothetical protein